MPAVASPIFFAHANGFPARSYQHFFAQLQPHPVYFENILSPGLAPIRRSWKEVVPQLIASIERQCQEPVVGLGHSFGAVVCFRAAQQRPDLFRQVIMMEPPLLSLSRRIGLAVTRSLGLAERVLPLSQTALKRKDRFASKAEAHAYWGQKRFFRSFDTQCFADYVEHALYEAEDGSFRLQIPREKEANIFALAPIRFGDTQLELPADYIYATHGDTLAEAQLASQQRSFADFRFHRWEGGHMFPLESPQAAAQLIRSLIEQAQKK